MSLLRIKYITPSRLYDEYNSKIVVIIFIENQPHGREKRFYWLENLNSMKESKTHCSLKDENVRVILSRR